MRTTALVTGYISTAFFLALGIRCANSWMQQRDKTSAHLAIATGLFGIAQLISVISTSLYDAAKAQTPPTWLSIVSGIIGLLPRLIFGSIDPKTLSNILQVAEYIAIVSAPLLFLGFSPPKWLANMFHSSPASAS